MDQAAPVSSTKILRSRLKKSQTIVPKEKACLAGIRLTGHVTPEPVLHVPSKAPRQQDTLSVHRGPWANLSSPLFLPALPMNTGDLPERGDQ